MIRVKKEVEAGFGATIANRVADQLRDDIVSHRIKPGSRITAKEIADKYGVSSMPVGRRSVCCAVKTCWK